MNDIDYSIINAFDRVLESLTDGEKYHQLPPRGPREDVAALSDEELKAKRLNENGESLAIDNNYDPVNFKNIDINIEDSMLPKEIICPTADELDGINICGINGSNQKIEKNSFFLILARAAIVNFKYSKGIEPPYFYRKHKDATAVTWVDGNIFTEEISLYTNRQLTKEKDNDGVSIFPALKGQMTCNNPFLVRYDHTKKDKSPSSHALGWAVKFQQALELLCLNEIETKEGRTICIKNGPLFSTSVM